MNLKEARTYRAAIETAAQSLNDKTASTAPGLYPKLKGKGMAVEAGTRINWNGQVKRAAVTLWDREDQDPDHAPGLWEDIDYVGGVRRIPAVITAGLAFALDELGYWTDGGTYKSLLEANVWTPEENPRGWEKQ